MINKVILLGCAGSDPELLNDGNICTLSLATNESWKDKNTGEKQTSTEWHRLVIFGSLAKVVSDYVKKGDKLYIEGKIKTDKYKDKEGVEKYSTKIIVSTLKFLGGQKEETQHNNKKDDEFYEDMPF